MNVKKAGSRGRNPRSNKARKNSNRSFSATGIRASVTSEEKKPNELIMALRECQKDYLSEEMKRYSNLKVVID